MNRIDAIEAEIDTLKNYLNDIEESKKDLEKQIDILREMLYRKPVYKKED